MVHTPFLRHVLELINDHDFTQTVKFPTRGNNILDIFCTNRPSLISGCYPIPGIGDHESVLINQCASHTTHITHALQLVVPPQWVGYS